MRAHKACLRTRWYARPMSLSEVVVAVGEVLKQKLVHGLVGCAAVLAAGLLTPLGAPLRKLHPMVETYAWFGLIFVLAVLAVDIARAIAGPLRKWNRRRGTRRRALARLTRDEKQILSEYLRSGGAPLKFLRGEPTVQALVNKNMLCPQSGEWDAVHYEIEDWALDAIRRDQRLLH